MSLRVDQLNGGVLVTAVNANDLVPVEQGGVLKPAPVSLIQASSGGLALDSTVVHNTGNETINGVKTFVAPPLLSNAALPLLDLDFTGNVLPETATLTLVLGTINRSTASGTLQTISFSGTPSISMPPTVLRLTVTNGPLALTIPASFRLAQVGSTTNVVISNGNHELSWVYDGQFWLADSITVFPQTGDISAGLVSLGLFTGTPTLADMEVSFTDNTVGNVSTSAHGYAPKLPGNGLLFLNGTGTWTAPGTSGGGAFVPTGTGFFYVASGTEAAGATAATGTGNVVCATSATVNGLTNTQLSNLSTQSCLYGVRFTDTSPVGHALLVTNAAQSISLLDFDISGTMQVGTIPVARISGILPLANGGTNTATPSLVAGSNVTITGTWPNQTIAASGVGGGSPGGSTSQVQWNNSSSFGGITGATTNGTTLTLTSPKLVTGINDTNGNPLFTFTATASAVTGLSLTNAAAAGIVLLSAQPPAQVAASTAGTQMTISASNAVAGSSTAGAAAGGGLNIQAGNASRLTSGAANGGLLSLSSGTAIGGGSNGNINLLCGGNGQWKIESVTPSLSPFIDNTFDIGTASLRVRHGFFVDLAGTITNDSAAAGKIGETMSTAVAVGSATSLTTATAANMMSLPLTAGEWDVTGNVNFTETGATVTARSAGINTASGIVPTDGTECYLGTQTTTTTETNTIVMPRKRISLATPTTVFMVASATFSAGTCAGFGAMTARRPR